MVICAPASVAVIPSTAMPATATITLHANLFTLPPLQCLYLPVVAEYRQFHKFIILTMMLLLSHDSAIGWEEF